MALLEVRVPAHSGARRRVVVLLLAAGALVAPIARVRAQEMDVPVSIQISIFLKVLTFDRALVGRAPAEVVVGIAFQRGSRASVLAKDEAVRALRAAPDGVAGVRVRIETVDLDVERLPEAIARRGLTHLYVTPLRATDVRTIAVVTRAAQVTTLSGVPAYVTQGLAIGVELRDGRPRILVNLRASRLEGADLAAELLKLATIVE